MPQGRRMRNVNIEELKSLISKNDLESKIKEMSCWMDESQQASYSLVLTLWKDDSVTLELVQRGSFYSDEVADGIKEQVTLPRIVVYDNYDVQAALDNGIPDYEIPQNAIDVYEDDFDLDKYLKKVVDLEES